MLLSDRDIRTEIDAGSLVVDPFDADLIQPNSIDVRLDRFFRIRNPTWSGPINPAADQQHRMIEVDRQPTDDPFELEPGAFVLGSTFERFEIPADLAGRVEGKSSLGRLGLMPHVAAGFVDSGFIGHITLELSNVAEDPILLWPGMLIGQLCLFRCTSPAERPYGAASGSRYQGQPRGPVSSRSFVGFRRGLPVAAPVIALRPGEAWPPVCPEHQLDGIATPVPGCWPCLTWLRPGR